MDENATPTRRTRPRPKRYPASLSIMTTDVQRKSVDAIADREDRTVGEVTRELIALGLREYDSSREIMRRGMV